MHVRRFRSQFSPPFPYYFLFDHPPFSHLSKPSSIMDNSNNGRQRTQVPKVKPTTPSTSQCWYSCLLKMSTSRPLKPIGKHSGSMSSSCSGKGRSRSKH
ncbi:hypothetical protein RchiOBHm_Chr7g0200921 [Rosa chinensis]|uniref:Uncharacterized protein n=1 Tax=Rosa chinensis TaxID=74649 RepID=A0A2P6P7T0_ROSCH|nr:hypothetical protein RchiOBHm_Chr7g0200921 [Rosa chinensis]